MNEMERQLQENNELLKEVLLGRRGGGGNMFGGSPGSGPPTTKWWETDLFKDLKVTVKEFDRALDQSNTSLHTFSKYNNSVAALTTSLGTLTSELTKKIPGIGSALDLLGKVVSEVAQLIFKQTDELLQASDQFAKIGAAGSLTTKQIMEMGEKAGLTTKDLGILTNATSKIGTGLIGLGVNATDGIKKFADMTQVLPNVRQEFQRMGVSQSELIDQMANYVDIQARSGKSMVSQAQDADKLKKSSLEYSENLLRLSALTGKSADVLQEEQKQQAMELEEMIAKRQEDDKIRELRKSGANAEADALEKEQKNRVAFITDMSAKYGKATAVALGKVARTGSYDQTTAGYANLGIDAGKIQSDLKNGMDGTKLANEVGEQLKVGMSSLLKNLGQGAQFNAQELFASMGFTDFKELLGKIGTSIGINDQAQSDAAKKLIEDNKLGIGKAATDFAQESRNFVKETEISLAQTKQGFIALANVFVQGPAMVQQNLVDAKDKLFNFVKNLMPDSLIKAAEKPSNILPKVNKAEAVGVGAAATVTGKVGEAVLGRVPVVGTAFTILKKVGKLEVYASLIDMVGGDQIAAWLKSDTKVEDLKKLPTTIATAATTVKDNIPNAAAAVTEEVLPGPKQFENIQKQWENTKNIFKTFSKLLGEIAGIPSASTAPVATPAVTTGSPDTSATRSHGTTGETGKEVEPKDVVAQLHAGEKVLPKEEAEKYIKDKTPVATTVAAAPVAAAPVAAAPVAAASKPWGKSGDENQDIGPAAVEAKSSNNKTNLGNFSIEDYIPNDRKMNDAGYNYIPVATPTAEVAAANPMGQDPAQRAQATAPAVTTPVSAPIAEVAAANPMGQDPAQRAQATAPAVTTPVSAPAEVATARPAISASETLSKVTLESVNPVVVEALKTISSTPDSTTTINNSNSEKMMFEVLSLFTDKCDEMIDKLEVANDIAARILRESR